MNVIVVNKFKQKKSLEKKNINIQNPHHGSGGHSIDRHPHHTSTCEHASKHYVTPAGGSVPQHHHVHNNDTSENNIDSVHHCHNGGANNSDNKMHNVNENKMAAPQLTTCQLPPCSNPSFDTFVAARATNNVGGGSCVTYAYPGHDNGQQPDKQMSVVDILKDIKTSSEATAAERHYYDDIPTAATKRGMQHAHHPPGCKPVLCPKVCWID